MAEKEYFLGLMSGTSLDGVDCALIEVSGPCEVKLLESSCVSLPESLKFSLSELSSAEHVSLSQMGLAARQISELSAQVVDTVLANSQILSAKISAIGFHGVTIRHLPDLPMTLQIGDASLLAERTGIDVVADFRSADMAVGGQGAPLVPAFHQAVLGDDKQSRVVLNLGGIANVTVLRPGSPILGFDTGPANTLINLWCERHQNQPFDEKGQWARSGKLIPELLEALLAEPYFNLAPPKSTGKELFNLAWLEQTLGKVNCLNASAVDIQATLVHLTAKSIADSLTPYLSKGQIIVCGGGVHNQFLLECLQNYVDGIRVSSTESFGVSADYMEAMAFAWLAYCRIHDIPAGRAACTGAARDAILGSWHRAG